jgi:uncharacterized PurR-regulated membrane protein YhhQ (DUF165 family)
LDYTLFPFGIKSICQKEHTKHRSFTGFILNLVAALAAYSFFSKKPSIKETVQETHPNKIKAFTTQLLLAA